MQVYKVSNQTTIFDNDEEKVTLKRFRSTATTYRVCGFFRGPLT